MAPMACAGSTKAKMFELEEPSLARKDDALEFAQEFLAVGSYMNGASHLQDYLDNYEAWLEKLELRKDCQVSDEAVPARTFFFVRKSDKRIIGVINIRLKLNETLRNSSGHIGYSIRPSERGKGYNKYNLYLALCFCKEQEMSEVLLEADRDNPASWRTIESLGGVLFEEKYDERFNCFVKRYKINVSDSVEKYRELCQ